MWKRTEDEWKEKCFLFEQWVDDDERNDRKVINAEILLDGFPIGHPMDGKELKLHCVADNFFINEIKKFNCS